MRIAQLVVLPVPEVELVEVDELPATRARRARLRLVGHVSRPVEPRDPRLGDPHAGRTASCSAGRRSRARSTGCCRAAASTAARRSSRRCAASSREELGVTADVQFEGPVAVVDSIAPESLRSREARRPHHLRRRPLASLAARTSRRTTPRSGARGSSRPTSSTTSSCTRRSSASSHAGSRATRPSTSARSGPRFRAPTAACAGARRPRPACAAPLRELVRERLELGRLAAGAMRERLCEQAIGEPRVARQQRAVQVGPVRRAGTRQPSKPDHAVVAEACDTRPSGSAPSSRIVRPAWFSKPASVSPGPRAVEQDVADHALRRRRPCAAAGAPMPGSSAPARSR